MGKLDGLLSLFLPLLFYVSPPPPLPWLLKAFKGTSIKVRAIVMGTRQARANRIVFTVYSICT